MAMGVHCRDELGSWKGCWPGRDEPAELLACAEPHDLWAWSWPNLQPLEPKSAVMHPELTKPLA